MIVVSGPSGVGKGTVLKALRESNPELVPSISATTRKPRAEDREGETYFFKSVPEFLKMIDRGQFMEWAEFSGNYYGTPLEYVESNLDEGHDVLLEIDVQGAMKLRENNIEGIYIFIAPENLEVLRERLRLRGTEGDEEIDRRIKAAEWELTLMNSYDYIVINRVVEDAAREIEDIIKKSKAE